MYVFRAVVGVAHAFTSGLSGMFQLCGVTENNKNPDRSLAGILEGVLNELIVAAQELPRPVCGFSSTSSCADINTGTRNAQQVVG